IEKIQVQGGRGRRYTTPRSFTEQQKYLQKARSNSDKRSRFYNRSLKTVHGFQMVAIFSKKKRLKQPYSAIR
ncbi:MAG: hypothetical protein ACKO4W_13795, partial [Bacteroidota bacterium]